ncbi:camphor resistance protein CrcB [Acetobacter pasteurianus]|uniref:Fluoride-specific ion channel FluC n=6 Tax=Acetobacter TaxID=434 RepID=A0A1Y0XVS3_ACEPA|nr:MULTISPECIES: fluoride efflux transporter CrcB [Acetobacter]NLG91800.1 fluoride efflux transporter CrcB [Acetobacter sp.]BAU37597.1 integral membrane protein CrcB [Acetobacter pasteurianus NBRC 101655]GBR55896.1 integral membrane protein CrcB [Acetobacter senegalensis DSM 18889]AKR48684.1 camphor resistance protein CrcB [Acetobacter pasteurianus]ARW46978.1 Putative fluoride ion transporter CrcB [Acetobacter pasteurianus subsp. pasteurianus]
MSFYSCLIVMLGGALGTLARYFVSVLTAPISRYIPWGTIIGVNMVGSFVIGFFGTLTLASGRYPVSETTRLFVMLGICGGYTTFSSFSLQTLDLIRVGGWGRALVNVVLSVTLSVGAVAVGHMLASRMNSHAILVAQTNTEEEV